MSVQPFVNFQPHIPLPKEQKKKGQGKTLPGTVRKFKGLPDAMTVADEPKQTDGWFNTDDLYRIFQCSSYTIQALWVLGIFTDTVVLAPRYKRYWLLAEPHRARVLAAFAEAKLGGNYHEVWNCGSLE